MAYINKIVVNGQEVNANQFEGILDKNGNARFVEGSIEYTGSNAGVHLEYGKWSLSGTHLMLVAAIKFDASSVIGNYELGLGTVALPDWILNKIYPTASTFVSYGSLKTTTSGLESTNNTFNLYLNKSTGKLTINCLNSVTVGASDEYIRIQFDLLIDND